MIVGYAEDDGVSRAFIYRSGRMVDLNTSIHRNSGWVLEQAFDINERGQIVGAGRHRGRDRAFLLLPLKGAAEFLRNDQK